MHMPNLAPVNHFPAAKRWFLCGTLALALAGLFAALMLSSKGFFYKGLVVHVDLSVLVWFMAIACLIWRLYSRHTMLNTAAFITFSLGMLCLPLSSAFPHGEGLMDNYIPIITHPLFYVGLSLLLCGVALSVASLLWSVMNRQEVALPALHPEFSSRSSVFAVVSSALIAVISIAAYFLVYPHIASAVTGTDFYDTLFWSGGHILQFAHTQLVMLVWLWLPAILGYRVRLSQNALCGVFAIGWIAALVGLFGTRLNPVSADYHDFYTHLMRDGNGIAPTIIILAILHATFTQRPERNPETRALRVALLSSIFLFSVGGLVGYHIHESNVITPAHYHGSIVGITLAYMGLCYYLMPRFGLAEVGHWKLAAVQPLIYCVGQLCWISGMFILGGYGVARKQTGVPDVQGHFAALGAILKHGGDGIALLGGLLFVVIVFMAYAKRPKL